MKECDIFPSSMTTKKVSLNTLRYNMVDRKLINCLVSLPNEKSTFSYYTREKKKLKK